jgi:hypothetical protein
VSDRVGLIVESRDVGALQEFKQTEAVVVGARASIGPSWA